MAGWAIEQAFSGPPGVASMGTNNKQLAGY